MAIHPGWEGGTQWACLPRGALSHCVRTQAWLSPGCEDSSGRSGEEERVCSVYAMLPHKQNWPVVLRIAGDLMG